MFRCFGGTFIVSGLRAKHPPQHDLPRTLLPLVRFGRLAQTKAFVADVLNRAVNEFEDRPRRAETLPQVEIAQGARLLRGAQLGDIACQTFHLPAHALLGPGKVFRTGALEPEDRLLVIADHEQRAQLIAMRAKPGQLAGDTTATLVGVVDFLAGQIDWITTEPSFGLEEFADHIRRCAGALRRWAADSDSQIGTRIACPSVLEHGSCGAPLRISTGGEPVLCRACGHAWTVEWLIRVAGDDADGWADMEAVCRLSGLHERTIRRWAKAGKVRKRGLLYNVRDISDATTEAASA